MGYQRRVHGSFRRFTKRVTMKCTGELREFIVVGRKLPSEAVPQPPLYKCRLFAPNTVSAKFRFWYFFSYYKKVKKNAGEVISCKKIPESSPGKVKNFGVWLRYDSRSGTHNMYREYRDTKVARAVTNCYPIWLPVTEPDLDPSRSCVLRKLPPKTARESTSSSCMTPTSSSHFHERP